MCRCRPDVSLLTCLWEYLCILYRWLLVAVYLERLQAAREQENLSSIEETLLNIACVELKNFEYCAKINLLNEFLIES